jgi:hypothetical protein
MFSRTRLALGSLVSLSLLACPAENKVDVAPTPTPAAPPARTGKVTLLVTGHETGLLPSKGARLLAQWKKEESWPNTLAFSTGDSFAGAVLSSHFDGTPTAEVMKALQYKAAAFGNHDLDLSVQTLQKFREESQLTLLAANLQDKDNAESPLKLAPSGVFTREGVKVGVIGFTSPKTLTTTQAGKATDLQMIALDTAVGPALESLKKDAPDVTVALIDDCFQVLKAVLDNHREWKIDLVVGTRCSEGAAEDVTGSTKYFSVGDDLTHYVSATYEVNGATVVPTKSSRRELAATGDEDGDLVVLRERWQKKLDAVMGDTIGFSKTGLKEDSVELRTLVATALKVQTKADAALINKKGIRAALPKGPLTRATIYDLIPFENAAITVKLKGEVLQKLKSHPDGFVVAPAKLEPEKLYVVATTEYIYFGGDGLGLEVVAPDPDFTGEVWQTPVVEWLRAQKSNEKKPIEALLKSLK